MLFVSFKAPYRILGVEVALFRMTRNKTCLVDNDHPMHQVMTRNINISIQMFVKNGFEEFLFWNVLQRAFCRSIESIPVI